MLTINDLEGNLFFNKKLTINYYGLINGLRNQRDGFAFFGAITHYHGKIINDFILNIKEDIFKDLKAKIYFSIVYDRTKKTFFFKGVKNINYKDIGSIDFSLIFFLKKTKDFPIIENNLIQFGSDEKFVLFEVFEDDSIKITVIYLGEEKKPEVENSFFYDKKDSPISLGKDAKINIEHLNSVCFLNYDTNKSLWFFQGKLNEIWLACDMKIEIKEDIMYFKLEKDIFQIMKEY